MKNLIIGASILLLLGIGAYTYMQKSALEAELGSVVPPVDTSLVQTDTSPVVPAVRKEKEVLGKSVDGRDIVAYHFGTGSTELLVVGGMHGSYSSNTAKVAEEVVTWLKANPAAIPASVSVTVIPVVNPDGLAKAAMRFNSNNVDLNRNFDCDWKAEGTWQNKKVSGGTAAFSEPESKSVQNFVDMYKPAAAVVFYSAAGGVYASSCGGAVSEGTRSLLNTYASASGYKAYETFDAYTVTGDMVNWLAKQGIPAISVLLTNHTDTDWAKNEKGLSAVLNLLAQ